MQIKIIVKTQRLNLSSNKIVCGTNNFIECLFDFQSSDWLELEKWALFKDGQNTYEMYIQDNKCIIPAQCISDKGEVIMSVVGRNNGKNITATAEDKLLLISGRAFDNLDEERLTPTYLEEVLGKVHDESLKTATSAQEAADSAAAALQSEKNAKASEKAAKTSKDSAAQSEANSKTSEDAARGYADDAKAIKGETETIKVEAEQAKQGAEAAKQDAEQSMLSAQNAANTAEKIASDLGLVEEAVQTAVSSAEQASNSATTASEKADIATAKADVATTKASEASAFATTATQKADVASASATNAAQSYANADAIATQLTEYLATKETLTAPAVDKTLLIEGAAADSKVVGELKNDVENLETIVDKYSEKEISTQLFDREKCTIGFMDLNGEIYSGGKL